jgi:glycosyltransferase involved in cell wall biosynthesis
VVPLGGHELAAEFATRILLNPELQREMSAAARTHACEQFSLRTAAGKLEKIYTRCLQNKRTGSKH